MRTEEGGGQEDLFEWAKGHEEGLANEVNDVEGVDKESFLSSEEKDRKAFFEGQEGDEHLGEGRREDWMVECSGEGTAGELLWLPARMVNEFVYCPRLFFYEFVEGVFVPSEDTERGRQLHRRVDGGKGELREGEEGEVIHARSVELGSEVLGVVAKLDLVEGEEGASGELMPVDYKAGAPRGEGEGRVGLWPTDEVQLGLQILLLRHNGFRCRRGVIYYRGTKQRVEWELTAEREQWVVEQVRAAREVVRRGERPAPLRDSPKCVRCSLAPVCLPDETVWMEERGVELPEMEVGAEGGREGGEGEETDEGAEGLAGAEPMRLERVRRLMAARPETKALYLNTQGAQVGVKGKVLEVRDQAGLLDKVRLMDVQQVCVFGNVQVTTQALRKLAEADVGVMFFSVGGWFWGVLRGHGMPNVLVRRKQFRAADDEGKCLALARRFVVGKVRNARTLLMRNAMPPQSTAVARLRHAAEAAERAGSLRELLGVEGAAAGVYFRAFGAMLRPEPEQEELPGLEGLERDGEQMRFDFEGRNRRPPRDPVNALLSLAYALLVKDCTAALVTVGLDPWVGFLHQLRPGRPALALDLMEEFRPIVADSAVITAVNNGMVQGEDFVRAGDGVNLGERARKRFLAVYEQRLNTLITHPVFGYRVCYRRAMELQARLLARALEGEAEGYVPFLTR